MANVVLVVAVVVVVLGVMSVVRRRRHGLVAERGMSIGADLGTMGDKPRVRVRAVTESGADRVRLVLSPEPGPADGDGAPADLDLLVVLRPEEFGFELLNGWKAAGSPLAFVMPPGSRIVRLRSIDDLQPLTLRRVEEG